MMLWSFLPVLTKDSPRQAPSDYRANHLFFKMEDGFDVWSETAFERNDHDSCTTNSAAAALKGAGVVDHMQVPWMKCDFWWTHAAMAAADRDRRLRPRRRPAPPFCA
jgi:hypothetical protein